MEEHITIPVYRAIDIFKRDLHRAHGECERLRAALREAIVALEKASAHRAANLAKEVLGDD